MGSFSSNALTQAAAFVDTLEESQSRNRLALSSWSWFAAASHVFKSENRTWNDGWCTEDREVVLVVTVRNWQCL